MQEYIKADQLIHQLTQIIAKANRTFVPKKQDDSHTNLYFDPVSDRIFGRWIKADKNDIIFALDLANFQFEILDQKFEVLSRHPIIGKKIVDLEVEIESGLKDVGLKTSGVTDPLHFEIPEYPFKGQPVEALSTGELQQWKRFRKLANETSLHLLGYLQAESEIRIWPHHFDTGIYAEVNADLGIGFGLAMADSMNPSPYFYLTGYPLSKKLLKYHELPALEAGQWIVGEHWNGAILPFDSLKPSGENEISNTVFAFISSAVSWYLKQ